jgi:hypothetical protein
MRRSTLSPPLLFSLLLLSAPLIAAGCASTNNQYAYAYPTAPPVYTQPAGYATPPVNPAAAPTVMPAPVAALPPGAVVAGPIPAGAFSPGSVAMQPGSMAMQTGSVSSLPPGAVLISDTVAHAGAVSEGPCPPMTTHAHAADGTLMPIAGESQTAPCPQEYVSEVGPGSFVR